MKYSAYICLAAFLCIASCQEYKLAEDAVEAQPHTDQESVDALYATDTEEAVIELSDDLSSTADKISEQGVLVREKVQDLFTMTKAGEEAASGIGRMERLFPDAGVWEERHRKAGLHRWYKVSYDKALPRTKAQEDLSNVPGVMTVEIIPQIKRTAIDLPFNDPYARSYQWQYYNDGTLLPGFKSGCDINVTPVWKNYTGGSSDVIVAVVDDGIYYNHPDLKGVVIAGGENGSRNFVRDSYTIIEGDHGTHVAGIIAAKNNNGVGCCGVAGGLDGKGGVRLLSCQVFEDNPADEDNPYTGNMVNAIVWGADHGAVISQNSWSFSYKTESQARSATLPASYKSAIDYFIEYAGTDNDGNQTGPMKGGIVVFAAGNDAWNYGQPASYDKVIAVGATGPDGKRASYSNYGDWVDICAPGGEGKRFSNSNAYILSLASSKYNYVQMCGTSMACPFVSGVAALLVSEFGGDGFTNEMLTELLLDNANTDIIPASDQIGGMVDAYASFKCAQGQKPRFVTEYAGNYKIATGEQLSVIYDIYDEDNRDYEITLTSDGSATLTEKSSRTCTIRFDSSEKNVGKHTMTLTGTSGRRTLTSKITYEIYINKPPQISLKYDASNMLKWHQSPVITAECIDPEGRTDLQNSISVTPPQAASIKTTDNGYSITLSSSKGQITGDVTIKVTSTDPFGASGEAETSFTYIENRAPQLTKSFSDIILKPENDKFSINLEEYFEDADDERPRISYAAENNEIIKISSTDTWCVIRGAKEGSTSLNVTAEDGLGMKTYASFRVGVYDDSKGPTLFPNPVKDYLTVRTGQETGITLDIYSEMGTKVLSLSGKASIFSPLVTDLTSLAPGRYKADLTCGGKTYKKEIVKL